MKLIGSDKQVKWALDILGDIDLSSAFKEVLKELESSVSVNPNGKRGSFDGIVIDKEEKEYLTGKVLEIVKKGEILASDVIDVRSSLRKYDYGNHMYYKLTPLISYIDVDGFKTIVK